MCQLMKMARNFSYRINCMSEVIVTASLPSNKQSANRIRPFNLIKLAAAFSKFICSAALSTSLIKLDSSFRCLLMENLMFSYDFTVERYVTVYVTSL